MTNRDSHRINDLAMARSGLSCSFFFEGTCFGKPDRVARTKRRATGPSARLIAFDSGCYCFFTGFFGTRLVGAGLLT